MEIILPVIKMGDETGTKTITSDGHELSIVNRSAVSIVLSVSSLPGQSITLPLGYTFAQKFLKFSSFTITAAAGSAWSYCIGG